MLPLLPHKASVCRRFGGGVSVDSGFQDRKTVVRYGGIGCIAQLGQLPKIRQKLDPKKNREIDWSYLCLQQFDKGETVIPL